jgi:hypothetical protein
MSSHFCDLCGLSEYEYEGSRAEYSHEMNSLFGNKLSRLCGNCRSALLEKVRKLLPQILKDIKQEKKDYWGSLDRGINR